MYIFANKYKKHTMKKNTSTIILLTIMHLHVFGQNIAGQWSGTLNVSGQSLRLVLHIHETENGYTATLNSLDQNATGIPITEISFENNKLIFNIQDVIYYTGTLRNDSIKGLFKQNSVLLPLSFSKEKKKKNKPHRPQEPKKPYPYYEEEVLIDNPNSQGITLAGTLTLPRKKGVFPAVILVSGSGQQNRNSEIFGHKPFLVISDYLTRRGIAVLRYDDRGTAFSTGIHDTCSTYDFSTDAEAVFKYLQERKEINHRQTGFIGHSEGGMIASMVAARNKEVAYLILLATPGIKGDSLLFLQSKSMIYGMSDTEIEIALNNRRRQDSIILHTTDSKQMEKNLTDFFEEIFDKQASPSSTPEEKEKFVKQSVQITTGKYYQYFVKYDPASVLSQVRCPVLALNGENDSQVSADENLNSLQSLLFEAGNRDITIKKLPKLNHLFQTSQTGSYLEYAQIEETFSPKVLKIMLKWLKKNKIK